MAGRVLSNAKSAEASREPPRLGHRRNPCPKRLYAARKPKDYRPARPCDLVQVDTLGGLSPMAYIAQQRMDEVS